MKRGDRVYINAKTQGGAVWAVSCATALTKFMVGTVQKQSGGKVEVYFDHQPCITHTINADLVFPLINQETK